MTARVEPQSGLVVVDKPAGITSHDVVARVRRLAGTRKVGHAGTLDPLATGVLVLGINKATRLLGHLTLTDKAYDATVRLGASTSTDDAEGEVGSQSSARHVSAEAVRVAFAGFVGVIDQVPSSVSAVKVDGRRAYALARAGEAVELAARSVRVDSLQVTGIRSVGDFLDVDLSVRCSSGTYVRAIARDVGAVLGVGGHLTALRRTTVGVFGLRDARTLDALGETFELLPLDQVVRQVFPSYVVDEQGGRDISFGRRLAVELPAGGPVAMCAESGAFLALYERRGAAAVAVAVFV